MPGVSKEQIEQAKKVGIVEYMLRHEPQNLVKQGRNRYILRDHDSFVISNGKWCWNSRDYGCETGTALNYLIDVRGITFVEAVRLLCDDKSLSYIPVKLPPPQPKAFCIPPRNRNNDRISAYLQGRGIDIQTIQECIKAGILYESSKYHNCVFIGRDEAGKPRFGCVRGTKGQFRHDLEDSDKRFAFVLPPEKQENKHNLAVFEAPIDVLSHKSMDRQGFIKWDGWRLALGGNTLLPLIFFLDKHPYIKTCFVCTDNDEVGNKLLFKIQDLQNDNNTDSPVDVIADFPKIGKDYSNMLSSLVDSKRKKDKINNISI